MPPEEKTLWKCPRCGAKFVTRNMWHSCGKFSLRAHFARSEPRVYRLYRRFVQLVRACGPVTIIPQKTRIAFQVRVRFAGITPRKSYLLVGFWFTERRDHPRFFRIERYYPSAYGHFLRLESDDDFDRDFKSWLREAYAIGQQAHRRPRRSS